MDNSRTLRAKRDAGVVDYSLARKATLRAYQSGAVSRFEICDAHPDLLRAARFCGQPDGPCPVCERGPVVLVKYVFSNDFSKRENGSVWTRESIEPLFKLREARLYTVEVCPDCSWNHVRSQLAIGASGIRGTTGDARRAAPSGIRGTTGDVRRAAPSGIGRGRAST